MGRASDIESTAAGILLRADQLEAPVDPLKVAVVLDVQVHFEKLDGMSGALVIKGDSKHAVIDLGQHPNRQRFTLAHELGHLVLHDGSGERLFVDNEMRVYQRADQPNPSANPTEEREANRFASALLMPRHLIEKHMSKLDFSDESDVALLARRFGVSDQAMSIRLQQLGFLQVIDAPL